MSLTKIDLEVLRQFFARPEGKAFVAVLETKLEAIDVKLRRASGEFQQILTDRFSEWGLTPAERDVALFAIKGMSTAEIAALRATSEGTVKAQTNAIYRKAGVTGRSQLLSLFIDDLMRDPGAPPARAQASESKSKIKAA